MPLLDIDGAKVKGNRRDSRRVGAAAGWPVGRQFRALASDRVLPRQSRRSGDAATAQAAASARRPERRRQWRAGSGHGAWPDGRLLVLEEGLEENAGRSRAWLGGANGWASLSYRGKAPYRPTDAATLPNGDIVVLERRASILGGFGARIVRVSAEDIQPGAELFGTELAVFEPPVTTDNYEGISAVRQPDGKVMLYVVSDDNFWGFSARCS